THGTDQSEQIWEFLDTRQDELNQTQRDLGTSESKSRLPQEVYIKAYSFMGRSRAFGNLTFEETANFIDTQDTWEEPQYLREMYPYYLSGYDYEGRPIWIVEFGKFNIKKTVEMGS
ncbi:unnamed protein product, partial [Allacma fusca]